MEDMTGRPWPFPNDQLAYGGGRMDPFWAAAGLTPADGHNSGIVVPLNLGAVDGRSLTWWSKGPLMVLPRLAAYPKDELADVKDAFRHRFRADGLVSARGQLELKQHCRLMSMRKCAKM
eukprot:6830535-Prymnesium_polylepis.2